MRRVIGSLQSALGVFGPSRVLAVMALALLLGAQPSWALAAGEMRWSAEQNVSDTPGRNSTWQEVTAVGRVVHVIWWDDTDGANPGSIYYKRSLDGGDTWQDLQVFTSAGYSRPAIAAWGNRVLALWKEASGSERVLRYALSVNAGADWGTSADLSGSAMVTTQAVAVGSGRIAVGWVETSGSSATMKLRVSADGANSWSSVQTTGTYTFSTSYGTELDVTVAQSAVLMCYQESGPPWAVKVIRSTDWGASWSSPVVVYSDPSLPQGDLEMAASAAAVVMRWSYHNEYDDDVRVSRSGDAGATWATPQLMAEGIAGTHLWGDICIWGDRAVTVWRNIPAPGASHFPLYYRVSDDGGATWEPAQELASDIYRFDDPSCAASVGFTYVTGKSTGDGMDIWAYRGETGATAADTLLSEDYNALAGGSSLPGWDSGAYAQDTEYISPPLGAMVNTNIPPAYQEFPLVRGRLTVEIWMNPKAGSDTNNGLWLGNAITKGSILGKGSDGRVWYHQSPSEGAQQVHIADYDGQWHHFRVVYDTNTNRFDLYMDGRMVGEQVLWLYDVSDGISMVGLNSGRWGYATDTTSYFDDLVVTRAVSLSDTVEILAEYTGPQDGQLRGLAWDGSNLWSVTHDAGWSSVFHKHNIDATLSIAQTLPSPFNYSVGMEYINGTWWSVDNFSDTIVKHGTSLGSNQSTYPMNGRRNPEDLAWSGTYIYATNANDYLQRYDLSGSFLGEDFMGQGNANGWNLVFVDDVLLMSYGNTIRLVDVATLEVVGAYVVPLEGFTANLSLAYDGTNLWLGNGQTNKIYKAALPVVSSADTLVSLIGGATMEMMKIEPGTFMMGSAASDLYAEPKEQPQHEVTISRGFYIGRTEVTQGQWQTVMGTTPWSGQDGVQVSPGNAATHVSWDDAQAFVQKLNDAAGAALYRLPTEAEWEYACRAGTATAWSFGNNEGDVGEYAWYYGNGWGAGEEYAHAVGEKRPNPWGLYDIHGNAREWCQDWYGSYSSAAQTDPAGPKSGSGRVVRGGNVADSPQYLISAFRLGPSPSSRSYGIGFRVLLAPDSEPIVDLGDVNGDKIVDAGDAILVLRHAAKLETLTGWQLVAADVNGDGQVDSGDAIPILQKSVGTIDTFPAESTTKPVIVASSTETRTADVTMLGDAISEVVLSLDHQVLGGDLTLTYDASRYAVTGVDGPEGFLTIPNIELEGEVRVSFARGQAKSPDALLVLRLSSEGRITDLPDLRLSGRLYGGDGLPIADLGLGQPTQMVPDEYSLSQNKPNPFNPGTSIPYALPEAGEIELRVYSPVGQLVRTLVSGWVEAGNHVAYWDGKDGSGMEVGSGVYLYHLSADGGRYTSTLRMVLLK